MGARSAGALDGEVAYLAGQVTKSLLFRGGALDVRGDDATADAFAERGTERALVAWDAYVEGALKAVATLLVSVPRPREVVISGRMSRIAAVREALVERLERLGGITVRVLAGFATVAKEAAQGAALVADGLAGGVHASLVETMGLRESRGTVLDHLRVISPAAARQRLGLD